MSTKKASFWKRLFAWTVDSIAIGLVTLLMLHLFNLDTTVESVFAVGMSFAYSVALEYCFQTTIGKSMLSLRIIRVDGRRPKFSDTICRNMGKVVSALPLYYGFTRILAPHRRQTIHDEIGWCLVIDVG